MNMDEAKRSIRVNLFAEWVIGRLAIILAIFIIMVIVVVISDSNRRVDLSSARDSISVSVNIHNNIEEE